MEKDSKNKELHSMETMNKEDEEPQLPVSDSPHSIPFHSLGGSFTANDHEVLHAAARAAEVANRIVHGVEHHYKVEEGIVDGGNNNSGFLMSKKEDKLIRALLWIRIIALVLSMLSFAVMADDRNKVVYENVFIVAKNSFYNIKEFQYELSVNVVGFIYSALQIWDILNFMFTKQHLVNHKWLRGFTFAMDQVMTYVILSASVSAATVGRIIVMNSGVSEFITMANASIAMSFLSFKAFALATLLSGYMLLKFN